MSASPVISAEGLRHTYPARRKAPAREALAGCDLALAKGEILGLLGPNGAGKSTLLSVLVGALKPDAGQVVVLGHDPSSEAGPMRRRLGVMFQSPALDGKLTCRENLHLHGRLYGLSDLPRRVAEGLATVGLSERAADLAGNLSGGQKRRLELAKALLPEPELLILDEPSTGLDPGAVRGLMDLLQQARSQRGLSVLLATHHMTEAERCDRLAVLHAGRVAAHGTPSEIRARAGLPFIHVELPPGADLPALRALLPEHWPVELRDSSLCLRPADPVAALAECSQRLAGRYRRLSLSEPGLDDAFLAITGASLQG